VHGLVIAQETIPGANLWYPTILGVLVVIAAVGLFCGTPYLLLATNLGSRLGFLVAAAGLTGMLFLISCLWLTTASPLNTLHGRAPSWKAVESLPSEDIARSKIPAVQTIHQTGTKVNTTEQANVKAAVDSTVVTPQGGPGEVTVTGTSKFAKYQQATDYIVSNTYETGGGNIFSQFKVSVNGTFPVLHLSTHKPLYAVVDICPIDEQAAIVPYGVKPPTPVCDKDVSKRESLVFEKDLGSTRVPPMVALFSFALLFTLCLLGLHWREKDMRERAAVLARASSGSSPTPQKA
jgi:hypothetical protein